MLHVDFIETMRKRMDALFEAYFGTDAAPLHRLKQEYGVTHLIVDTRHFTDREHVPEYFSPWQARILPRLKEIEGRVFLMNATMQRDAAIFNQNNFILIDLGKLR